MTTSASTLEYLPCGQHALISAVDVDADLRGRLSALGLACGKEVWVLRRASLGGPLHVRVGSTEIILRRHEAAHIQVSPPRALAA
jgi:ferrous iron transport protein A